MDSKSTVPLHATGDSVFYCFKYLYRLAYYGGIVTFQLHNLVEGAAKCTAAHVWFAICMRFVLVVGFFSSFAIKVSDEQMAAALYKELTAVLKVIITWECLCSNLTYIVYCISMDLKRSQHMQLLCSMQRLDLDISAQFPHVQWHYRKSYVKYLYGVAIVGISYFMLSFILVVNTANCNCGYLTTFVCALTFSLLTGTLAMVSFMHIGAMDYLRLRYRLIVKLLQQQLYAPTGGKLHTAEQQQQLIGQLFAYSKRCSYILLDMNACFALISAAGIFYDFTIMTCLIYVVCQMALHHQRVDEEYVFIAAMISLHVYKVVITCYYGYTLKREKRNCHQRLREYGARFGGSAVARDLVDGFQHWQLHNNHIATIGRTMPCSIFMIYVVFNGITNYVVILVQLLFQQEQLKSSAQQMLLDKQVEILTTKH